MPGETVELLFRIRGENIEILDRAGNKLGEVAAKAKDAEQATSGLGAAGVTSLNRYAASAVEAARGVGLVTTAVGGLAAVGVAAFAAMAKSAQENIARAEEMRTLAGTTGLATKELSQLEYIARRNSVELGTLGGGLQSLNTAAAQASGGVGRNALLLAALGVEARDTSGQLRGALPVFLDTADAFNALPEGATKSAAAVRLFGGDAAAMLQVMDGGSAKIRALTDDAVQLGYSLDADVAASAKAVTDNLDRASSAAYGLGLQLGQPLLQPLAQVTGYMADLAESANRFASTDVWSNFINGAVRSIPYVGTIVRLLDAAKAIIPSTPERPQLGDVSGVFPGDQLAGLADTATNGTPLKFQREQILAALLANPPRRTGGGGSGAGAANRLAQLTDQSLLGAQQANVTNAQTALTLAQQDLDVFRQRLDLEGVFAKTQSERLVLLDAGQQQELALAQQIDAAKQREIDAQIAVLEARKQDYDVVEAASKGLTGQLDLLNAQEDSLRAQKDLIAGTGGEAARVANEYARARAELEAQRRVVVDLGATFNTSLQRAADGLFNSGGKFNIGNLAADTGKAIGSSLVGGFIEAQLKKVEFDQMVSDNFTVTLPGFMQTGADAIGSIWGGLMDAMGFGSQQAGDAIAGSFVNAFGETSGAAQSAGNIITGVLRNVPLLGSLFGGAASATTPIAGAIASSPVYDAFGSIIGYESAATGAGLSAGGAAGAGGAGLGAGGIGAIGGAVAGSLGALGTAAVAAYLGANLIGGIGALDSRKDITLQRQTSGQRQLEESGLWNPGAIAAAVVVPIVGQFYAIIAGILSAFIDAPSKGTQLKIGIQKSLPRTFPQQRDINIGGETGVRTQFIEAAPTAAEAARFAALGYTADLFPGLNQTIESVPKARNRLLPDIQAAQAARPEVDQLRYGAALGLGTVLAKSGQGSSYANTLVNNLLLTGVSEGEARRLLLQVAERNNVDFDSGLEELNKRYRNNRRGFKDDPTTEAREDIQQFTAGVEGLVDLFQEDVPAGVDVSAIALSNFTEKGGIDIAEFNEDLERSLDIFGRLQKTQEAGLRTGLDVGVESLAKRNALISAGGPINQIIRANLDARQGVISSLFDSIQSGFTTAITDGVQDAIQDTPQWKALTDRVADAVNGAPLGDIGTIVGDLVNASLPQLEAAATAISTLRSQLGITPTALTQSADVIKAEIESRRFNALSPRNQQSFLESKNATLDQKIAALYADGVLTPDEAVLLRQYAQEKADTGFKLADLAGSRYLPGSEAERRAREAGLSIAEDAEKLFRDAAKEQADRITAQTTAATANTTATDANTAATNRLTDTILGGATNYAGGGSSAHVGAGGGSMVVVVDHTGAPVSPEAERRFVAMVNHMLASGKLSPAARSGLRKIGQAS